jgi:hypothetical protein
VKRLPYPLAAAAGLLFVSIAIVSCSDEESSTEAVAPEGPAAVAIEAFIGANSQSFARGEASAITVDCSGNLAVDLVLENWLLRPPGNCGATAQCGHVAVTVGDVLVEAATEVVLVPLGDAAEGTHHVSVELRLDDHSTFLGDAGTPVTDALEITVERAACPEPSGAGGEAGSGGAPSGGQGGAGGQGDAGAGGEAGSGGAGGAPSSGGQGGVGGQGGEAGSGGAGGG